MSECLVCKKELPDPWSVCFKCSSTRKQEVFKALEQLARDMAYKRNEM